MSGAGRPEPAEAGIDGGDLTIAIVAGRWHEHIADGLTAGAQRVLAAAGVRHFVVEVPGAFELALMAQTLLAAEGVNAVVALGVIVRGGTPHFEYVSDAATSGLTRVMLDTGKPVGFGLLTLDDEQQGLDRAGLPGSKEDKGAEAATAALAMARFHRDLREDPGRLFP